MDTVTFITWMATVLLVFQITLNHLVKPNGDIILTNPPFGSDLSDKADISRIVKENLLDFFLSSGLYWLKPGGRLGVIIEDSVLNGQMKMCDDLFLNTVL